MVYEQKLGDDGQLKLPKEICRNMGVGPDDAVRLLPIEAGVVLVSAAGAASALSEEDIAALQSGYPVGADVEQHEEEKAST